MGSYLFELHHQDKYSHQQVLQDLSLIMWSGKFVARFIWVNCKNFLSVPKKFTTLKVFQKLNIFRLNLDFMLFKVKIRSLQKNAEILFLF